ncbi:MAG: hypothetical protein REI11_10005 [Patulibacter sp.]|nr:hypothetical protein [Patulibacter sp.]
MSTTSQHSDVESAARQLLEGRVQSVTALDEITREEADLTERLSAVQTERAKRYAAATKNGWTDAELGKLGFHKPGTRARRRSPGRVAPANGAGGESPASDE